VVEIRLREGIGDVTRRTGSKKGKKKRKRLRDPRPDDLSE
jgi:hypothetical protein